MTAHGLAAFVGWAAFALMGISWWILAECGFPIQGWGLAVRGRVLVDDDRRRHGRRRHLASAMGFARLVGVPLSAPRSMAPAPRTELTGTLRALDPLGRPLDLRLLLRHPCDGHRAGPRRPQPPLRESARLRRSASATSGRGDSRPSSRFRIPVIPLTVIAVDMIIATVPLAVLLVEMVVQVDLAGADGRIRCLRRACCGGSGIRSCTCCSSRRCPSTTT